MTVIGNRLSHQVKFGRAILPGTINNATVDGDTILEPWRHGRQIAFFFVGGTIAAGATGACVVEGRLRSDGVTWEAITGLAMTPADISDTGTLDGGAVMGELDLSALDATTYDAIRLSFTESATAALPVGVAYVISDLYRHPSGEVADLWDDQRP